MPSPDCPKYRGKITLQQEGDRTHRGDGVPAVRDQHGGGVAQRLHVALPGEMDVEERKSARLTVVRDQLDAGLVLTLGNVRCDRREFIGMGIMYLRVILYVCTFAGFVLCGVIRMALILFHGVHICFVFSGFSCMCRFPAGGWAGRGSGRGRVRSFG